jgi:hypothetical protein
MRVWRDKQGWWRIQPPATGHVCTNSLGQQKRRTPPSQTHYTSCCFLQNSVLNLKEHDDPGVFISFSTFWFQDASGSSGYAESNGTMIVAMAWMPYVGTLCCAIESLQSGVSLQGVWRTTKTAVSLVCVLAEIRMRCFSNESLNH